MADLIVHGGHPLSGTIVPSGNKNSVLPIICATLLTDEPVTLRGWVRTRRDSKAGLSFVHISDGSCFHPVQVVAEGKLANYESEVKRLTAGCAVEAVGRIVPSPAKGQPFEMQADEIRVVIQVEAARQ